MPAVQIIHLTILLHPTSFGYSLNSDVRVGVSDVLEQSIVFLAHKRLAMVAGYVVPVNAIVVKVVEHGQTVLVGAALLQLTVVGLRLADATVGRPIVLVAIGGRGEFLQLSGPEPAVDGDGLQIGTIASLEVADATAGPDVLDLKMKRCFSRFAQN